MEIDLSTSLTRKYVLRRRTSKGDYDSYEVTVPLEVVQREYRRLGLTLEEFEDRYQVVWYMGQYPGLYLTFEEKEKAPIPEGGASVAPVGGASVGQETPNPPSKTGG